MEQKIPLDSRARLRLRWIEHYERVSKKVLPACRYFGISRGTFYLWYHRYMQFGIEGLKNKSSRPHKICRWVPKDVVATILMLRQQRQYGAIRMSYYLKEKYHWYVSHTTIQKLYREHGMGRLKYKKRWRRYLPRHRSRKNVPHISERLLAESRKTAQRTFAIVRSYDTCSSCPEWQTSGGT